MILGTQAMPTAPVHHHTGIQLLFSARTFPWTYVGWWSNRREPFFVQQSPLFPTLLDPLSCHNSWKSRSGSQSLPDLLQLTLLVHNDVCHPLIVQFLRQQTTSKTKSPQRYLLASLHVFSSFTKAHILVAIIQL